MNLCYVFIGPSGSGKTTLASAVFSPEQKIITYTTRPPRLHERNNVDYHFVSKEKFEQMITENELAEWDVYASDYYGSGKQEILQKLKQGDCYTVITAKGFWHLYGVFGDCIHPIFVTLPKDQLRERLIKRGDSLEKVQERLALFDADQREIDRLKTLPTLLLFENKQSLEIEKEKLKQAIFQTKAH